MTEQPDTAAIRAGDHDYRPEELKWVLCDALDAARAEPALDIAYVDVLLAKIGELSARAEAAEARIAATREILRDAYDRGDFEAIDRALTAGTP